MADRAADSTTSAGPSTAPAAAAEEPRYTVDELLGDARARVGASRPAIAGALKLAGGNRTKFTIAETKQLVNEFLKREVKS